MGDVRSYVAFKRECLKCMPLGINVEVSRSGGFWSVGIRGEWVSVWGNWYIGHPQTVQEYCKELVADWENESWKNAHI